MSINCKRILYCFLAAVLLAALLLSGCAMPGKRKGVPKIDMIVENPLPVERIDEFVVLKIADLREMAPDFSPKTFIVLDTASNEEISHQLDDMNNDGEGDEISMIMDMGPNERKAIVIRYAPDGRKVNLGYENRTRAAIHPEYEGIGWESELIAYRIYPDHRNSIGVFGKQEKGLSLDKFAASVYDKGFNHIAEWGVNVLDGDDSLGCGGFGLWYNNELMKPLNMVGQSLPKPHDQVARYTRIVADGPIRAVVQVIYDNWRIGDQSVRVTATYSIFAGQRITRNHVKIEGADNPVKIAVGLTSSDSAPLKRDEKDGFFYSWGAQSHREKPDDLGLAVIYPIENYDSFYENDKSGAHLAVLDVGADNEIAYWFMAAWSRGEIGIKEDSLFADLIASETQKIRNPLTVTIMPVKSEAAEKASQKTEKDQS